MRFTGLFKTPRHQRFEYQPRHYDPIKADLDRRVKDAGLAGQGGNVSSICFERSKRKAGRSSSLLQLLIVGILSLTIVGWVLWGNAIFYYLMFGLIPVYLYFRNQRSSTQR